MTVGLQISLDDFIVLLGKSEGKVFKRHPPNPKKRKKKDIASHQKNKKKEKKRTREVLTLLI